MGRWRSVKCGEVECDICGEVEVCDVWGGGGV